MPLLFDKFNEALIADAEGTSLSKRVVAALGSTNACSLGASTAANIGILAFYCLLKLLLGPSCFRGLIQGNYTAL
jgi:hypothetical protein